MAGDGHSTSGKRAARGGHQSGELASGGSQAAGEPPAGTQRARPGRKPRTSIPCQVPGCGAELINDKAYLKRYKICEPHYQSSSLDIGGQAVRFCQQCGRFQPLEEFFGSKRSCEMKLKRHNERRFEWKERKRAAAAAGSSPPGSAQTRSGEQAQELEQEQEREEEQQQASQGGRQQRSQQQVQTSLQQQQQQRRQAQQQQQQKQKHRIRLRLQRTGSGAQAGLFGSNAGSSGADAAGGRAHASAAPAASSSGLEGLLTLQAGQKGPAPSQAASSHSNCSRATGGEAVCPSDGSAGGADPSKQPSAAAAWQVASSYPAVPTAGGAAASRAQLEPAAAATAAAGLVAAVGAVTPGTALHGDGGTALAAAARPRSFSPSLAAGPVPVRQQASAELSLLLGWLGQGCSPAAAQNATGTAGAQQADHFATLLAMPSLGLSTLPSLGLLSSPAAGDHPALMQAAQEAGALGAVHGLSAQPSLSAFCRPPPGLAAQQQMQHGVQAPAPPEQAQQMHSRGHADPPVSPPPLDPARAVRAQWSHPLRPSRTGSRACTFSFSRTPPAGPNEAGAADGRWGVGGPAPAATAAAGSGSGGGSQLDQAIQKELMCPITGQAMREPVVASDGCTYERAAIETWIKAQQAQGQLPCSPVTLHPLYDLSLRPNQLAKALADGLRASGLLPF